MNPIVLMPLLFALSFFLYFTKGKTSHMVKYNILGVGALGVYVVYSVFAVLLYFHPDFQYTSTSGDGVFSYEASLFLFAGLFICILPFLKGNFAGFKKVKMCKELEWLFSILIVCGIVEILLYIPHASHGFDLMGTDIAEIRDEGEKLGGRVSDNPFLSKFIMIYDLFSLILPLGYFYYIKFTEKKVKAIMIISVYVIIPFLKVLATGSRDNFVFPLITFMASYLIFYHILDNKVKKGINIVLVSFVGVVFAISAIMSYSRFAESGWDPNYHILAYIGQGITQFNSRMYDHIDIACWGDFNFAFYRSLLGLDYSIDNEMRRTVWGARLHYPTNVFYTHFGAYVADFGKIGAFLFVIVIGWMVSAFTKVEGEVIRFSQLIILLLVARIVFCGGFYFIDCAFFGGLRIFYFIILCFLLRVCRDS